jgi:transposase
MFSDLGNFSNCRLTPVENGCHPKKRLPNIQKHESSNSFLASSNATFLPSLAADHDDLLEAVLLVYTGSLSPQNIGKHFNISRQRVINIINAMPNGLKSESNSRTKQLERAARKCIGNTISIYTHEELKAAMFAFAHGEYSYADILAEFGVGDSTLRKKMAALRTSLHVDKIGFEKIMVM